MGEARDDGKRWLHAARSAGADYRRISTDPRVRGLAQAGPAMILGMSMRVAGEDGHVPLCVPAGDARFARVKYIHPSAHNDH